MLKGLLTGNLFDPTGKNGAEPLYWALADSTDYFWSKDLVAEQSYYNGYDGGASAFEDRGYDTSAHCELDYGEDNYCHRN